LESSAPPSALSWLTSSLPPTGDEPLRVVLGPQRDYFTEPAIAALLGSKFPVSESADRMGMRLDGPLPQHRGG
jgi:allophanate hydrolase subunit 2